MFARFNLIVEGKFIEYTDSKWPMLNARNKRCIQQKLREILDNEIIDANTLEELCFPQVKAHIFLSHSHDDVDLARNVARHLYDEYGLICFIDEELWEYADDLLRELDNKKCYDESKGTYNYRKRNSTTAQVHMLLQVALAKMIDETELFVFLNTPNAATINEMTNEGYTKSPWIYAEIMQSSINRRKLGRKVSVFANSCSHALLESQMEFPVNLKGFYRLTMDDIELASEDGAAGVKLLDNLYAELGIDSECEDLY